MEGAFAGLLAAAFASFFAVSSFLEAGLLLPPLEAGFFAALSGSCPSFSDMLPGATNSPLEIETTLLSAPGEDKLPGEENAK